MIERAALRSMSRNATPLYQSHERRTAFNSTELLHLYDLAGKASDDEDCRNIWPAPELQRTHEAPGTEDVDTARCPLEIVRIDEEYGDVIGIGNNFCDVVRLSVAATSCRGRI